jgi:hypothetical protein
VPPDGAPARPKKKIPTWYYIVGAVGLVGAYYLYQRSKASSAAAAGGAAAAGATAPVASGSYGNAGDLASLLPYLQAQQSATTGQAAGSGGVGTLTGSGYGSGPGSTAYGTWGGSSTPQTSLSFEQLAPGQTIPSSVIVFYQPVPGVFQPAPQQGKGVAAGTPLFVQPNPGQPTGLQQGNTGSGTVMVP